jgi:hypothetical protein
VKVLDLSQSNKHFNVEPRVNAYIVYNHYLCMTYIKFCRFNFYLESLFGFTKKLKKLKCYITIIEETLDPVVYCGCRLPAPCLSNDILRDDIDRNIL